MPVGPVNEHSGVPLGVNTCTWFDVSSLTRMMLLPFASTPALMPSVEGKWYDQAELATPVAALSTCTRLLPVSSTYSLPPR